jgi:hypothetical protein
MSYIRAPETLQPPSEELLGVDFTEFRDSDAAILPAYELMT